MKINGYNLRLSILTILYDGFSTSSGDQRKLQYIPSHLFLFRNKVNRTHHKTSDNVKNDMKTHKVRLAQYSTYHPDLF